MIIRQYQPSDCKKLAELFYHTVHTINAKDYTKEQLNAWATGNVDLEKWNQSFQEHNSVVAVEDGVLVGFGDIDETGYLDRLYVHKNYQGKGIATAICDKLEQTVQGTVVTHASITAKPFFEKRGYKVVREQQVERQGVLLANYVMEKIREPVFTNSVVEKPEEMIGIAKRENNTKRNYLVVNKYQGKHVPISPSRPLEMFSELAKAVAERYQEEKLLLIGFAETATAIGEAVAIELGTDYMQTTREHISDVEYLYFSESHSHATEQKVVKNDLDFVIGRIDRIVFVEDEVTTGNTIGKIVHLIQQTYGKRLHFSVASLLNGMDEKALERYQKEQIDVVYLRKTDHSRYPEIAEGYSGDGIYHESLRLPHPLKVEEFMASGYVNARRLHKGKDYQAACEKLWQEINAKVSFGIGSNILVLGTEEFMYAPLYVAQKIQDLGNTVKYHATTRSPIMVSRNPQYPLHERYELVSMYEESRRTYLYDLAVYDLVLIITDAEPGKELGAASLYSAIAKCGNERIYLVRWCEDEKFLSGK